MEEEEQEKEGGGDIGITVEAKRFSCWPSRKGIVLVEKHRQGERQLLLSLEQSRWITEGLLEIYHRFGETRRKQTLESGGSCVALIEGSNHRGCFLSIQIRTGKTMSFVIVPAGVKGLQWRNISSYISGVINSMEANGIALRKPINGEAGRTINVEPKSFNRSFAQIVEGGCPKPDDVNTLEDRVRALEKELLELRLQVAQMEAANPNTTSTMKEGIDSRKISEISTAQISEDSLGLPEVKANNSGINTPSSIISHENRKTTDLPCEKTRDIKAKVNTLLKGEYVEILKKIVISVIKELSISDIEGSKDIKGGVSVEDDDVIKNDITPENTQSPTDDSEEGETLEKVFTTESSEEEQAALDETDPSDKEVDVSLVTWDNDEEAFIHEASGLRFWPKHDFYYSFVDPEGPNQRSLFYEIVKGKINLIEVGAAGRYNREVLDDPDFDKSLIFTEISKGYHPEIEQFFKIYIDKGNM